MPTITARGSGRVNLIGEHTDHTDGLALPAAIEHGVEIAGTADGEGRIVLSSDHAAEEIDVAADGSEPPPTGWGRYVSAVAAELAGLGRPPVGLRGRVTSTLPAGIGLSSSAALEVAVAVALLRAAAASQAAPAPVAAIDLALALRRAEHRAVGVPSGVLDQAASLLGVAGGAILLDCADLSTRAIALPGDLAILIVDSGVRRDLESSAYGLRTTELGAALPALLGRRPAEVDPSELPALLADVDEVPARRMRHVVTENARVRATVQALAEDDRPRLGSLFAESHQSMREDFEATVAETDALCEMLQDAGAVAARQTGGGFGGGVLALVARDRASAIGEAVRGRYVAAFPSRTPQVMVTEAVAGAARDAADVIALP